MVAMKRFAFAAIGLLACVSISHADVTQDVALAAGDPAMIPGMVKTIEKKDVSEFISKLIKVLAAKPASPVARVQGLVKSSKLIFSNVSQDKFADAIVASTANVPFNALPEWTRLCKTTTKAISVNMSDPQYDAIVNKVIKDIANLASVPKENKAVVTICALELLARAKTPEDEFAWLSKIKGIPEGYRQDVVDGYKAMSKGDYSSLFGDTKIIKVPGDAAAEKPAKTDEKAKKADEKKPAQPEAKVEKPAKDEGAKAEKPADSGKTTMRLVDPVEGPNPPGVLVPGAQNLPDTKVGGSGTGVTGDSIKPFGTDRPAPTPAVKPMPPAPKPHKPHKPVVPEPYRGQF